MTLENVSFFVVGFLFCALFMSVVHLIQTEDEWRKWNNGGAGEI